MSRGDDVTPYPTTEDEARTIINRLMISTARGRGVRAESLALGSRESTESFQSMLTPWMAGPKNILPTLERLAAEGSTITPLDFSNILAVATMLEPSIALDYFLRWHEDLPEPSLTARWDCAESDTE